MFSCFIRHTRTFKTSQPSSVGHQNRMCPFTVENINRRKHFAFLEPPQLEFVHHSQNYRVISGESERWIRKHWIPYFLCSFLRKFCLLWEILDPPLIIQVYTTSKIFMCHILQCSKNWLVFSIAKETSGKDTNGVNFGVGDTTM